jgi:gas vesicle protein
MFFRKSRARSAKDAVAGQVTERTDDLITALDAAREAISKASTAAGHKGTELGKEAGRRSTELRKEAGRRGRRAARRGGTAARRGTRAARGAASQAAEMLPEPEQVADLTRRAADKLFPERAKQRREAARKRRRRVLFGSAGLLGTGLLAGWLTAPRRGAETRQALKEQAAKASEKGWERVSEPPSEAAAPTAAPERSADEQQGAEVTSIHQGNGASNPSKTPPG